MRSLARERGSALTLVVVAMPLIIALLGLAVDGGFAGLQKARLVTAADAASRAAASAVDWPHYNRTRELRIEPVEAQRRAVAFARANLGVSVRVRTHVPPDRPNAIDVRVEMEVPTFFIRVFGIGRLSVAAEARTILYRSSGGRSGA